MKFASTVVILWLFASHVWGSTTSLRYSEINMKDGLSQSTVLDMTQDIQGFMWFATQDGLNRYDGYTFEVYRYDSNNPNSLSHNYINNIFQDSNGFLWLATRKGLNRFDPRTNEFVRFFHDKQDPYSLGDNLVVAINEDHLGHIWVGSQEHGLSVYNPITKRFIHYQHDPNDPTSLSDNGIYDILVDRTGVLWIATQNGGVSRFNKEKNNFTQFKYDVNNPYSISSNKIYKIFQHSDGSIWFGSRGAGLNRFEQNTQRFIRYRHEAANLNSLSEDHIWSIVEDQNGDLLIGTFTKGLNRLIHNTRTFIHIGHDNASKYGLSGNSVISSYLDKQGAIWFGIRDVGLNILNQQHAAFNHYRHIASDSTSLSDNAIKHVIQTQDGKILMATKEGGINLFNKTTGVFTPFTHELHPTPPLLSEPINQLMEDKQGNIWIAFKNNGVAKYNSRNAQIVNYRYSSEDNNTISDNFVTSVVEDINGNIWIGTRNGLNYLNTQTGQIKRYISRIDDPSSLSSNWVTHLLIDHKQRLWVSSQYGINVYDPDIDGFRLYSYDEYNDKSIASDSVFSAFEDQDNVLWIATGKGLSRFHEANHQFTTFNKADGLTDEIVFGIEEDSQGNLWLMTSQGLSRFDKNIGEFSHFTVRDGLQGEQFNPNAIEKLSDGQIIIGGVNGFNLFNPLKIAVNKQSPDTVITHFRISNQIVPVGKFVNGREEATILTNSINYTDLITLDHEESVFSFEFTSFAYHNAQDIQFSYRLQGFDSQWTQTNYRNRRATYTNLAAGDYHFEVKASNKDGEWNENPAVITLKIKPQWWLTKFAKFLWLVIFFASAVYVYRYKSNQIRKQKTDLQLQVSRQVAQVVQQKRALETSYNDIKVLSGIGQKINASLDLEKVLWAVYEDINRLMDGTIFGIGLVQHDEDRIKIKLAMEKGNRYKPYYRSMKNKNQFPVWCIDNNEVVFVNDLELEGRRYLQHHEYDDPQGHHFMSENGEPNEDVVFTQTPQSFIYVPMRSSDEVLGFLSVQSFHKHAYSDVHVDILKTLAAYTGPAIINAKEHQELLESRKELIESEKMASLGALTAGVAHEINNPTNFVHVSASNLESDLGAYQEFLEALVGDDGDQEILKLLNQRLAPLYTHIKTMKEGTERIKTIVHDLRAFTHLDAIEKRSVSISENILSTIHLIQTQFFDVAEFVTDFTDDPELNCYPSQLNQVYMNLIVNACDAIKDKQEQLVREGKTPMKGKVVIGCRSLITHVEITIKDNGIGMNESTKKRLFEPFYTTKAVGKGSGLGLSISYGIVKKHEGNLTVESTTGVGTSFKLLFPFQTSVMTAKNATEKPEQEQETVD